ncbi:DUF6387 family protein [Cupriavidus sp. 2TAF22]|uniref:DUF6387 family protein n=1 Tax=unclassified Cupriavidus TaxID=2640874 RepID=UPI003F937B56
MSRHKITQEELKGFSLEKYSSLAKFSYAQWRDLIFHRSLLWDFTDRLRSVVTPPHDDLGLSASMLHSCTTGLDSDAAEISASLLNDPLGCALHLPPPIDTANPLATTFIKLIPQDYIGPLPPHADALSGKLFGTLDGVPLNQPYVGTNPTSRRVLLEVDVDAPDDSLLLADFTKWLRQWRQASGGKVRKNAARENLAWVRTEIDRWLGRRLVPYIDLKLVARLIGKDFSAGTLETLLKNKASLDDWETVEEWLEDYRARFLSQSWLDVIWRMAFEEAGHEVVKKSQ